MEYGEMRPTPVEVVVVRQAEEACIQEAWEDECIDRVPEMAHLDDDEFCGWRDWLAELDEMTADEVDGDLAACAWRLDEIAAGWIEDEHGGAVYVEDDDD